ncbi:hypothetical protein ABT340_31935 [Streptosporangium sp. NPDC000239]|uniref:hypothetical protein n=1 Tax=Streptosporangium sp. NPDC000239 TaxID=3154248 RepID=UPI00331E9D86
MSTPEDILGFAYFRNSGGLRIEIQNINDESAMDAWLRGKPLWASWFAKLQQDIADFVGSSQRSADVGRRAAFPVVFFYGSPPRPSWKPQINDQEPAVAPMNCDVPHVCFR